MRHLNGITFGMRVTLPILVLCLMFSNCAKKHGITKCPAAVFNSKTEKLNFSHRQIGSSIYTLENGGISYVTRLWFFSTVSKSIDIQHYIFKRDRTGMMICDYLLHAADRGVKIRLIIDEVAVKQGTKVMTALDDHENIEIKVYNPGFKLAKNIVHRAKMISKPERVNQRMHIKSIILDNEVSIMGGRNFADEYFDYDKRYNFRDRDIVMAGKVTEKLTETFNAYWNDTLSIPLKDLVRKKFYVRTEKVVEEIHKHACDTANFSERMKKQVQEYPQLFDSLQKHKLIFETNAVSIVADAPGKNGNKDEMKGGISTDSIAALLNAAKRSVLIQSPYVILSEESEKLFRSLIQKGIKIKVLTNSLASTDNNEAFNGYKRDRKKILDMGIDIYEYKPSPQVKYRLMIPEMQAKLNYKPTLGLHSKSMIIDDSVCVIGTYNMDPRSENLNNESIAIVRLPQFVKYLHKHFEEEFLPDNAWHVTKEWNPDKEAPVKKRLKVASRFFVPKKIL